MKKIFRNILLIFFILYSLFFFIGSTLAPVFAYLKQYYYSDVLTYLYVHSCHQQPDRSFWLFGYPIALCCRCYGFYLGVILTGFIMLLYKKTIKNRFILCSFFVAFTDILINLKNIDTGNITRFICGFSLGFLFIQILNCLFKEKEKKLCK